jgi:putative flippase GtrA
VVLKQYLKFFINGGLLGIASWVLQAGIFAALGGGSSAAYAIATALTYVPLIIINFLVQRRWIFGQHGIFLRFVVANLAIMLLVSALSPLCRLLIAVGIGPRWGDLGGFVLAALLGSVPSFFLVRTWVFSAAQRART